MTLSLDEHNSYQWWMLVLVLFVCWCWCRQEVRQLLRFHTHIQDGIPLTSFRDKAYDTWMGSDYERAKRKAGLAVMQALGMSLAMLAWTHAYDSAHSLLVAQRNAALMQPPPWQCLDNMDWNALSYASQMQVLLHGNAADECALYLASINTNVWPNPAQVTLDVFLLVPLARSADTMGAGMQGFLHHFPWVLQVLLLVGVPVMGLALLLAAPWIQASHWWAARFRPRYNDTQIEDISAAYRPLHCSSRSLIKGTP